MKGKGTVSEMWPPIFLSQPTLLHHNINRDSLVLIFIDIRGYMYRTCSQEKEPNETFPQLWAPWNPFDPIPVGGIDRWSFLEAVNPVRVLCNQAAHFCNGPKSMWADPVNHFLVRVLPTFFSTQQPANPIEQRQPYRFDWLVSMCYMAFDCPETYSE
jgi:hypothetical protein